MARSVAALALLGAVAVQGVMFRVPPKDPVVEKPGHIDGRVINMRAKDGQGEAYTAQHQLVDQELRDKMTEAIQRVADESSQRAPISMRQKAEWGSPEERAAEELSKPALKGCMADDRNKLNDKDHFEWRDSILKWVQPWKYEEETLRKYQKDPVIKKIFYINNGNGNRAEFMEQGLKWVEHIPHEKYQGITREEVANMQVNGGVPQMCWEFSSGGMGEYLKSMQYDDVTGTVACYLSHARLLDKLGHEDGNSTDIYAIMEDDVGLNPNWDVDLMEAVKALPPDWDIARFVYWGGKRCEDAVPYLKEGQNKTMWYEARGPDSLNNINMYAGNQAYLIRPKSVTHILETLRNLPVMDIDGAIGSNHQESQKEVDGKPVSINWGLHTYVTEMPLGLHKMLDSTRVVSNKNEWQDTWGDGTKKARVPIITPWTVWR